LVILLTLEYKEMITITLYYRKGNAECDQVRLDLQALQEISPHQLVEVDVDLDPALKDSYGVSVPVLDVGPYHLRAPFTRQDLQAALMAARDRQTHFEQVGDTTYLSRLQRGHTLTRADRFSHWFSNRYVLVFNLVFLIFAGLPFLAPIFMNVEAVGPAKVIYTIYSPLCHQLAFRSWFLFGEQAAYPRALANVGGLITFEQATGLPGEDVLDARAFIGNETLGYKVAFCERDVAIYGAIFLFGLIFAATGKKIKSIPWYVWIIIGIIPIGIDGFSQIPSLLSGSLPAWLPIRESTPFLRTLTGFLFGFMTAWYGFPYIEESMRDTRRLLSQKIAVVAQSKKG
jgi:uncharacterized membrane protein